MPAMSNAVTESLRVFGRIGFSSAHHPCTLHGMAFLAPFIM